MDMGHKNGMKRSEMPNEFALILGPLAAAVNANI